MISISPKKIKSPLVVEGYMISRITPINTSVSYWETYNVSDPFYTIYGFLQRKMINEKD